MEPSRLLNLAVAIGLTLAVYLLGYVLWYIFLGRRNKARKNTDASRDQTKKKSKKNRWGVDKDAYCYPHINDDLDFELIRVVQLAEEERPKEEKEKGGWASSQGVGTSEMTVHNAGQARTEAEEEIPNTPDETMGGTMEHVPGNENDEPEINEEESTIIDATPHELEMVEQTMSTWMNRDYDNDDEDIDHIINMHEEDIENPGGNDYEPYNAVKSEREWSRAIELAEEAMMNQNSEINAIANGDEFYGEEEQP